MDEKECKECIKFRNDVDRIKYIEHNKNCIVHGFGNLNSEVLFVGECPGIYGAALTCVPLTKDISGQIVQKALIKLELSNKCFLTNLFRCYSYT